MKLTSKKLIQLLGSPVKKTMGDIADGSLLDDTGELFIQLENGTVLIYETGKMNCGAYSESFSISYQYVTEHIFENELNGCWQYGHQEPEVHYFNKKITNICYQKLEECEAIWNQS